MTLAATQYALISIYDAREERDKAQTLAEESLRLARRFGHKRIEAMALRQLSCFLDDSGDFEKATLLIQKSLHIFRRIEDKLGCGLALVQLAKLWSRTGETEQSKAAWQEVQMIADSFTNEQLQMLIAQNRTWH